VEEASAASESMAQKAGELKEAVSQFKIGETNLRFSPASSSSFSDRSASVKKTEASRPLSRSSKPARKVVGGASDAHFEANEPPKLTITNDDDIF
jgi:cell division septum initiation protein DivIVA